MTPPAAVGFANGAAQSIVSLARCLGPILGGYVSVPFSFPLFSDADMTCAALVGEHAGRSVGVPARIPSMWRGVCDRCGTQLFDPIIRWRFRDCSLHPFSLSYSLSHLLHSAAAYCIIRTHSSLAVLQCILYHVRRRRHPVGYYRPDCNCGDLAHVSLLHQMDLSHAFRFLLDSV